MADRRVRVTLTANVSEFTRSVNRAAGEVDDLRRSAERFGTRTYKAKIDVDIPASALGKISGLNNRLNQINGRTATAKVRVNDAGTSSRARLIAAALFAIGPAAVAGGAVAGAALTALALTVGTLVAGLGVAGLAFQGVGKALKAMNEADEQSSSDSAAAAKQRVQSYRSIADASKQVSRAQRDGAEAVAAAEERVADAQAGVVAAQKRVEDSLGDLHGARQQAIRDLEDLRDRSNDDGNDEEAAKIRLIDAENALTAARKAAEGVSTNVLAAAGDQAEADLNLRKAKLELAQATDNLSDVQRQAKRNTVDLAAAEKAGVEGSAGVVQAKNNIADANADLVASGKDLKDAQAGVARAQAQAVESVADAQLGLQRAIEDASEAMGEQSTSAKKLAEELAKLGPEGQAFVRYLRDLKPLIQQLQNSAQGNMFPGITDGMDAAKRALPEFDLMVRGVSRGIGAMSKEAGNAFSSPFWKGYFKFIADEATPTFLGFFGIIEKVARGIGGMQQAFAPYTREVIADLNRLADRFANWGASLKSNTGFVSFMDYIREVGPLVNQTFKSLGKALLDVGKAMGQAAPFVLMGLEAFAKLISVIAGLPVIGPVLFGFASALGAVYLATRLLAVIGATALIPFLARIPALLAAASLAAGVFAERMALAAGASAGFAATSGVAVATAGSRIAGGMAAVGRALPIIGALLIAGSIALDAWGSKAEENADRVVKGSMSMNDAIKAEIDNINSRTLFWLTAEDQAKDYAEAEKRVRDEVEKNLALMSPLARAQAQVHMAQDRVNESLRDFNTPAVEAALAAEDLRKKTYELEIQQTMVALGIDRQTASLYNLITAQDKARDSSNSLERADIALRKQYETTTLAQKDAKLSTDEKRLSELDLEDAIRRAATALVDKRVKDAEAAGASDIGKIKADAQRDAYKLLADTVKSPLREQILKLGEETRTLPDKVTTVTVNGVLGTQAEFQKTLGEIKTLFNSVGPSSIGVQTPIRRASGGYIAGPGTQTSDSIPALLSNGEYVVKASSVSRLGTGALDHINSQGSLPGFAKGGAVLNGNLPALGLRRNQSTQAASEALWSAVAMTAAAAKALAQGSARSTGGDGMGVFGGQGLEAALTWARGQAGKPYVWGGNGRPGWDCSGFIAGIANVARGKAPARIGTTFTMPWGGFAAGSKGDFVVGNTNKGVGHMAATLLGVNVETRGSAGTVVGPGARGAHDPLFDEKYVFQYDNGGFIPPGMSTVYNGTGKPEPVFTSNQWDNIRAAGGSGGSASVTKHYHLTVVNAGGSGVDLKTQFSRLEMMSGVA